MPSPSSTHARLESAGRNLWIELEGTLAKSTTYPPAPVVPNLVDLGEELRREKPEEVLEEILQHLRDLGYLKGKVEVSGGIVQDFTHWRFRPDDSPILIAALEEFRSDCRHPHSLLDPSLELPPEIPRPGPDDPLVVQSGELLLLRTLTSLDGLVRFRMVPVEGETSLGVRVIHHLLRTYGVLPEVFPPGRHYGPETTCALDGLSALIRKGEPVESPLSLLNELADFSTVAMRFADAFADRLLLIPGPSGGGWDTSLSTQREAITRYGRDNARMLKRHDQPWRPTDLQVFATRLLQIYLWHRGHYLGEVDGLWGPKTHASLISAASVHSGNAPAHPVMDFVSEREGFLRVRVSDFIRSCEAKPPVIHSKSIQESPPDPAADLFSLQDTISQQLRKMMDTTTSPATAEEQEALVWRRLFDGVDASTAAQRANPATRRNFGTGMIGRGVARILENLKRFVHDAVVRIQTFVDRVKAFVDTLLGELNGAVLQAFRFLERGLTRVTRIAMLAGKRFLRFLSGEPFVTRFGGGTWIATRFSFDQDAVSYCGPDVSPACCDAHLAAILEENRSLEVVLKLGVAVLGAAAVFVPPLAAWKAAKLAFSVFRITWEVVQGEKQRSDKLPDGWDESVFVL